MNDRQKIVQLAISHFLKLAAVSTAFLSNSSIAEENIQQEQCYGIVKKGMNDCATHTASCAGSAIKDRQPDAFLLVPKGMCEKIVGGNLTPPNKKSDKSK